MSYNNEKTIAELKINLNTQDDVYLDFSNTSDLTDNIDQGNYSYDGDDKSYTFSIAKNGDYNFEAIVLADGKDYDSKTLGTKSISVDVDELVETGKTKNNYDIETADNLKTLTIDLGNHSGVDLAYYYWCDGESDSAQLHKVSDEQTSVQIENCLDENNTPKGYLLFVVKPKDGYVFTGVNASGSGQIWIIKEGDIKSEDYKSGDAGVGNYDGVTSLIEKARNEGYTTCFGWSKHSSGMPNHRLECKTEAAVPSMNIKITAKDNNIDLLPGQKAHLTISITPTLPKTGSNVTNTTTKVEITHVNGVELTTPYDLYDNDNDGTYTCDADYTITDEDFKNGKVTFTGTGKVTYQSKLTATSGEVTRTNVVTGEGKAEINPFSYFDKNKALITYEFKALDTTKELPEEVKKLLPTFEEDTAQKDGSTVKTNVHYTLVDITNTDDTFTPTALDKTEVVVDDIHSWIFQGWSPASQKFSDMTKSNADTYSQTFTGVWAYLNTSLVITAKNVTKVYDGEPLSNNTIKTTWDTVDRSNAEPTLKYATYDDENGTWSEFSETEPTITDVGTLRVMVQAEMENYETKTSEYTLTVTKRSVTFTGKSDALIYTGNDIKIEGVIISGDGLAANQTHNVVASAFGKNIGTHSGTITSATSVVIKDKNGKDVTKNYNITTITGNLKIYLEKIVTCEEEMGSKNWTWSETKQACVYKVSNTSAE